MLKWSIHKYYLFAVLTLVAKMSYGQNFNHKVYAEVQKVESQEELLLEYERLGPKISGSPGLKNTFLWLLDYYKRIGVDYLRIDTFIYNDEAHYNLVAGYLGRNISRRIMVSAHYDTKGGPGVNDNGTGVTACMEIARLLRGRPIQTGIEFIHFSAEENNLIGSQHYVNNVLGRNDSSLVFLLNLDQLGGTKNNSENNKIYCERDEDSPLQNNNASNAITQKLAQCADLYSNLAPVISKAYSSDYMPFQQAFYVITGLYQYSEYPFYHTKNDLLLNIDIGVHKEVIKTAYAFLLLEADSISLSISNKNKVAMHIFPNPVKKEFTIDVPKEFGESKISLTNTLGQNVFKSEVRVGRNKIVFDHDTGLYFGSIKGSKGQMGIFKIQKVN